MLLIPLLLFFALADAASETDCNQDALETCFKETFVKFSRPKRSSGAEPISCVDYAELNRCFGRLKIHLTCSSDKLGTVAMFAYRKYVQNVTDLHNGLTPTMMLSRNHFIAIMGHLMRTCNTPQTCSSTLVAQCTDALNKASRRKHGSPYDQYMAYRLEVAAVQGQMNSRAIPIKEGCVRIQAILFTLHQEYHSKYCGHRPQDISACVCRQWGLEKACGAHHLCTSVSDPQVSFVQVKTFEVENFRDGPMSGYVQQSSANIFSQSLLLPAVIFAFYDMAK